MNYSLLKAEQELYSKQAVRAKPALNPSENDLTCDEDEIQMQELCERNAERSWGEDYGSDD